MQNNWEMPRIIVIILVGFGLISSCKKEELSPRYGIYGDPDQPVVVGLTVFDQFIQGKDVKLEGDMVGSARLVLDNTYMIYEPAQGSPQDEVAVIIDGFERIRISYESTEGNMGCIIQAKPFVLSVKKNSPKGTYTFSTTLCIPSTEIDAISITLKYIHPISGITTFSNFDSVGFEFEPEKDFVGFGELIYELSRKGSDSGLPGLLQITVVE